MKTGLDIVKEFPGLLVIHQKIPAYEAGRHSHEEHEFFMPLQGEISIEHGGVQVKAGPGRMLYVPPKIDHSFTSSAQGSGERVIWLIKDSLWKKHIASDFPMLSIAANSLARELLFYLLIHDKAPGEKYFISALVETLADSLGGAISQQKHLSSRHVAGRVKDPRVKKALELIEDSWRDCSLAEIAKDSGQSSRTLSRLFLNEVGLSPKEYITLLRMERAKELLRTGELTVTDTALEVGYNSLSKFISAFKRAEGVLPSEFRTKATS